jgi:hypothetical protein
MSIRTCAAIIAVTSFASAASAAQICVSATSSCTARVGDSVEPTPRAVDQGLAAENAFEPTTEPAKTSPPGESKAPFTPIEAPADSKALIADVVRENLATELAALGELRAQGAHSEHTRIGPILQITDFEGWVSLRFSEPAKNLKVSVTQLRKTSPTEIQVAMSAECPAGGHAHAGIKKGPSIGSNFSAVIKLSIAATITRNGDSYKPTLTAVNPSLVGLRFKDKIVDLFHGVAQTAVNNWAAANKEQLRVKANEALQKSVNDAKLKRVLGGLGS